MFFSSFSLGIVVLLLLLLVYFYSFTCFYMRIYMTVFRRSILFARTFDVCVLLLCVYGLAGYVSNRPRHRCFGIFTGNIWYVWLMIKRVSVFSGVLVRLTIKYTNIMLSIKLVTFR